MERENPYTLLGVTPTATQAEITRAYRTQLRALHPDTRITPPVSDKKLSDVVCNGHTNSMDAWPTGLPHF